MRRVFVSSTVQDLRRHRKAVTDSLEQFGATVVAMEMFGARDERPKAECLRIVREETDVLVGIYARRYGFIPDGDAISITQQEYEQALVAKIPTLVYLVDRDYRVRQDQVEAEDSADRLAAFLEQLQEDRMYDRFTTPKDLAASVVADVGRYFLGHAEKTVVRHGLVHRPRADWVSGAGQNQLKYKLVVFDFDGTLLRGNKFDFSWEAIWNALGFAESQQAELSREYTRIVGLGVSAETRIAAYQDWCDKACEMFKTRKLTRDGLRKLTASMHLTVNCREALTQLRRAGIATAIVSGGVNTFLEDTFPDYREYVDFVFINELAFSGDGELEGVLATAYDFEGKMDAFNLVCERVGCAPSEAVFVGDRFNDEVVLAKSGLGIAYPPNDYSARRAAKVIIDEDDLLKILPPILGN